MNKLRKCFSGICVDRHFYSRFVSRCVHGADIQTLACICVMAKERHGDFYFVSSMRTLFLTNESLLYCCAGCVTGDALPPGFWRNVGSPAALVSASVNCKAKANGDWHGLCGVHQTGLELWSEGWGVRLLSGCFPSPAHLHPRW